MQYIPSTGREMLAHPFFKCLSLYYCGKVRGPASPRFSEVQVKVFLVVSPPTLFAGILARQEIIPSDSFRYELPQYMAPEHIAYFVGRVVRVESFLQRINCVPVAESELCGDRFSVQPQDPELESILLKRRSSDKVIEVASRSRGETSQ